MKNLAFYLLIGLVLIAFYVWRYRIPPSIEFPEVNVQTQNGLQPLESLAEGPVLINFYASWCGPCMNEMPSLNQAHRSGVFTVIAVTDDTPDRIAKVREHYKLDFPLYQLENSLKDYGVYTIPTSYLLNENGNVVASMTNPENWHSDEFLNKARTWLSK